jgi:hypothetical protein
MFFIRKTNAEEDLRQRTLPIAGRMEWSKLHAAVSMGKNWTGSWAPQTGLSSCIKRGVLCVYNSMVVLSCSVIRIESLYVGLQESEKEQDNTSANSNRVFDFPFVLQFGFMIWNGSDILACQFVSCRAKTALWKNGMKIIW